MTVSLFGLMQNKNGPPGEGHLSIRLNAIIET